MANPFLELNPDELFTRTLVGTAVPEEEKDEEFLDSTYLENLQDISYGKTMPAEESQKIAQAPRQKTVTEETLDFASLDPNNLFGASFAEQQATLPKISDEDKASSNRIIRFGKNVINATLSSTLELADYAYTYGPLMPTNMLRNFAAGKPLFESPGIAETIKYDIPEAQTREEEIDDVAAAVFGTGLSFFIPLSLGAKAVQTVKQGPRTFGMLTPDVVVNVAGRPSLINKLPPKVQQTLKNAADTLVQAPVVGPAVKRSAEAVSSVARITRQAAPRLLDDIVEEYTKTPGRALAFEALALTGASYGAAVAETIAPGSITGRMYGELLGGAGSMLTSGLALGATRVAQQAIKEPATTFKNVLERFGYDQKGQLQILNWIEEAEKEYLTLMGQEVNKENLDRLRADMVRDINNIDEALKDLPLGVATGNPILLAFESRMAKLAPDFNAQRQKAIESAYDGFYSYIKAAMETGNPNQINRAARLQQQAMLDGVQRRIDTAKLNAIEISNKLNTTNAAEASAKQYEIVSKALADTRKTESKLWEVAVDEIQPRQAFAYRTSLDTFNEIKFDLEREAASIKGEFQRMRDTAEYLELKALKESTPVELRNSPTYKRLQKRISAFNSKYPSAGKKIKAYMNLGFSEETASMLTGNTLDSVAGQATGPIFTTRDLHKLRSKVLEKGRLAKDANQKRVYSELAEALLRDLINSSDNSEEYLTAINFSRALNQRWTQGFVGKALRGKEMGSVSPETLLDRAFNRSGGVKSRLQLKALQRASTPLDIDPEDLTISSEIAHAARNTQEDFVRANLYKFVDQNTGLIRPRALNDFLADKNNQLILEEMPALKADLENAQRSQALIDSLLDTKSLTKADLADAALSNFLGKRQSDKVISTILVESNATENFAKLVREIRQNPDKIIEDLGDTLSKQEIADLRESASAALEGLQYSLFRIAHNVAREGDFVDFGKMRSWLEAPVNVGEASPLAMIKENRVLTESEISGLLAYITKGEKLQTSLAANDIQASLEAMDDPLSDLVLRIAGARMGSQMGQMMGGGSSGLIAPAAGSQFLRNAFSKIPTTKMQAAGLAMLKDKELLTEVLQAKLTRQNQMQQFLKIRAFLFSAGYVSLANMMDATLSEVPVAGDVTGAIMEDIERQRLVEPSNFTQPLEAPISQMQRRMLEESQRL